MLLDREENQWIFFVAVVIFAKNQNSADVLIIYDEQSIEFMVHSNIVCFAKGDTATLPVCQKGS